MLRSKNEKINTLVKHATQATTWLTPYEWIDTLRPLSFDEAIKYSSVTPQEALSFQKAIELGLHRFTQECTAHTLLLKGRCVGVVVLVKHYMWRDVLTFTVPPQEHQVIVDFIRRSIEHACSRANVDPVGLVGESLPYYGPSSKENL